jgi:hypothetical protein
LEWNSGYLATTVAGNFIHGAVSAVALIPTAVFPLLTARRASGRFVRETLFGEKLLLAFCKLEGLSTIPTL